MDEERILFLNLVSCPEGLAAVYAAYPKVRVVTAWVDDALNAEKFIVPGLGGELSSAHLVEISLDSLLARQTLGIVTLPFELVAMSIYSH